MSTSLNRRIHPVRAAKVRVAVARNRMHIITAGLLMAATASVVALTATLSAVL